MHDFDVGLYTKTSRVFVMMAPGFGATVWQYYMSICMVDGRGD